MELGAENKASNCISVDSVPSAHASHQGAQGLLGCLGMVGSPPGCPPGKAVQLIPSVGPGTESCHARDCPPRLRVVQPQPERPLLMDPAELHSDRRALASTLQCLWDFNPGPKGVHVALPLRECSSSPSVSTSCVTAAETGHAGPFPSDMSSQIKSTPLWRDAACGPHSAPPIGSVSSA